MPLANGLDVPEAVKEAQDYTWHALQQGFRPGMGQYLPDHLFWARDPDAEGETDVQPTMQPAPNTHLFFETQVPKTAATDGNAPGTRHRRSAAVGA